MTNQDLVFNFLGQDNFITVHRSVLLALQGNSNDAIFLSHLISLYKNIQKDCEGGWFFQTVESVEQNLGMTDHLQRSSLKRLQAKGLLLTDRRGSPARRYIKLNMEVIYNTLFLGKPPELKPKQKEAKQIRSEFYEELNKGLQRKQYETFLKESSGNLDKEFATLLYCLTSLSKGLTWNSRTLGQLLSWFKKMNKQLQAHEVESYFEGDAKFTVYTFIEHTKSCYEKPTDERESLSTLARRLSKEKNIDG